MDAPQSNRPSRTVFDSGGAQRITFQLALNV